MSKVNKIKEIVAQFLKVDPAGLNDGTFIDNSALHSSVLTHRMYAELVKEGVQVNAPQDIRTLGDLLSVLDGPQHGHVEKKVDRVVSQGISAQSATNGTRGDISIGIDMEDVENMPETNDYREEPFYSRNFSQKEISYCILQPDPRRSFAGKFAAKEAVIKADNSYRTKTFNQIEILNDSVGKPVFENFVVSISHAQDKAVAVAVEQRPANISSETITVDEVNTMVRESLHGEERRNQSIKGISILAILISSIAVALAIWSIFS
jgi:phosphopantetheine--protein transferase-like protein